MTTDRTLTGIALMLAFCVLAPLLDTASKLATATIPVGQITGARFLVQGLLMLPIALLMRLPLAMNRRISGLVLARAVCLILSTYGFVAGVSVMPCWPRLNSATPKKSSSADTWREIAPWVSASSCAARVKLPWRAAASKQARAWVEGSLRRMGGLVAGQI